MSLSQCKKVSFCDERYANEYIAKLNKTSQRKLKPVRAYLCEKCFTWHLTSIHTIDSCQDKKLELETERLLAKEEKQQQYEQRGIEMQNQKYNKLNNKYNILCQNHKKIKEEYLLFKISVSILIM